LGKLQYLIEISTPLEKKQKGNLYGLPFLINLLLPAAGLLSLMSVQSHLPFQLQLRAKE
jgi:hypothetical protein